MASISGDLPFLILSIMMTMIIAAAVSEKYTLSPMMTWTDTDKKKQTKHISTHTHTTDIFTNFSRWTVVDIRQEIFKNNDCIIQVFAHEDYSII